MAKKRVPPIRFFGCKNYMQLLQLFLLLLLPAPCPCSVLLAPAPAAVTLVARLTMAFTHTTKKAV